MWITILRTSDPDDFVRECAGYMRQCIPFKMKLKDLTDGERTYFNNQMNSKTAEVTEWLRANGFPIPQPGDPDVEGNRITTVGAEPDATV